MSNGADDLFGEARRRQRSADIVGAMNAVSRPTFSDRVAKLMTPVGEPVPAEPDPAPEPAYTHFTHHELATLYAAFEKATGRTWASEVQAIADDWKRSVRSRSDRLRFGMIMWDPIVDECRANGLEIGNTRCSGRLSTEAKWVAYGQGATREDVARIKKGWLMELNAKANAAPVVAAAPPADDDPVEHAADILRDALRGATAAVDAIRKSLDRAELRRARIMDALRSLESTK
jgi:hypothetical protein